VNTPFGRRREPNHPADYSDCASSGGAADMAVQLGVGLLSERRIGADRRNYHHSSGVGSARLARCGAAFRLRAGFNRRCSCPFLFGRMPLSLPGCRHLLVGRASPCAGRVARLFEYSTRSEQRARGARRRSVCPTKTKWHWPFRAALLSARCSLSRFTMRYPESEWRI
jgi:hypothetical protein